MTEEAKARRRRVAMDTTPIQRGFHAAVILIVHGPQTTKQLATRLGLTVNATWRMMDNLCASHDFALTFIDGKWTLLVDFAW